MKRLTVMLAATMFVAVSGTHGEDPAPADPAAPAVAGKPGFVVAATYDFDGIKKYSVVSPAEMIALKKGLPKQNEAARKAFTRVKKDWYEKHTPPPQPVQQTQPLPTVAQKPGINIDLRTTAQTSQVRPKPQPFPIKVVPVKEIRELETCATEEAAKERIKFYEDRDAELKKKTSSDDPFASGEFGAGSKSAFASTTTQKKGEPKKYTSEVDPKTRDEVMKQLVAEIENILAGAPEKTETPSGNAPKKKEGLGTGVGNTFKSSGFGAKK